MSRHDSGTFLLPCLLLPSRRSWFIPMLYFCLVLLHLWLTSCFFFLSYMYKALLWMVSQGYIKDSLPSDSFSVASVDHLTCHSFATTHIVKSDKQMKNYCTSKWSNRIYWTLNATIVYYSVTVCSYIIFSMPKWQTTSSHSSQNKRYDKKTLPEMRYPSSSEWRQIGRL